MSKSSKITMGIVSFIPAFLVLAYFITLFVTVVDTVAHHVPHDDDFGTFTNFFWIIAMAVIMSVVSIALMIYFIIQVVNNKALEGTERLMWVLLFVLVGVIGFPLYWYMKVWKSPEPSSLA